MNTSPTPHRSTLPQPPGPRAFPRFGHVTAWRRDPLKLLGEAARYGDVVRLELNGPAYLVAHPEFVKRVLVDNQGNYAKGWVFNRVKEFWGESLLTIEGDQWRQQRRRVQPEFTRDAVRAFAPVITGRTAEMLDRWRSLSQSGESVSLYHEVTKLALVIIGDILFGADLWQEAPAMASDIQRAFAILKNRVAALLPAPLWLATPQNRRFNAAMGRLYRELDRLFERERNAPSGRRTFLTMLMEARDPETGLEMSGKQLREEALGMLQQGHDTIAEALSWAFYLLSRHPEIERRLHTEVSKTLNGRPPMPADLGRLPYATMVVHESMRLYPPVWMIPRQSKDEDQMGGFRIVRGATILVCPYVTHRHPAFWENPEAFDPERFLPERAHGRPRYAYFPFGGGPRMCMGVDMAMMEVVLILAMIVSRYRVDLAAWQREEPDCVMDMVPRYGVHVTLHERKSPEYDSTSQGGRPRMGAFVEH